MAKALQPAVTAGEIFFELDRFELGDGDRLELSGRWFGVRGRRFVRPSLAVISEDGPLRALADLEHKPWAAEDGQAWEAAFPWRDHAEMLEAELSVAPDITIKLPVPGEEVGGAQRLTVSATGRGRKPRPATEGAGPAPAQRRSRRSPRSAQGDGELDRVRAELKGAREEVDRLRAEQEGTRQELDRLRAELEGSQLAAAQSSNEAAAAGVELAAAQQQRHTAVGGMQAAIEARDAAARARDALVAERDRERRERERLGAELDRSEQSVQWLSSELEQARGAVRHAMREHREVAESRDAALGERDALLQTQEQLAQERDEAVASRGAALVMRNASRAMSRHHHRHAGWVQRGLAIVVLIGAAFALLIVLHVL